MFGSNSEMYAALVGFVLPPLLAMVMQWHWSSGTKAVVAFVACALFGVGTAYFSGVLGADWLADVLIVFTLAKVSYEGLWKPTGVAGAIEGNVFSTKPDVADVASYVAPLPLDGGSSHFRSALTTPPTPPHKEEV